MYDIITAEILCPVCGRITKQDGQTKDFDCGVVNHYDVKSLPFDKLGEYYGEKQKKISYVYFPMGEKQRNWRLEINAIMECSICHVYSNVTFEFGSKTYTKRKHTSDWELTEISMTSIWPNTLPSIRKKIKRCFPYLNFKYSINDNIKLLAKEWSR